VFLCGYPLSRVTHLARPSVCPSVPPVRVCNSENKKKTQLKIKIVVDVPHGTSKWNVSFQFERSKVKVTGRKNLQNLASSLLAGFSRQAKMMLTLLKLKHFAVYLSK